MNQPSNPKKERLPASYHDPNHMENHRPLWNAYQTYVITDNKILPDGSIISRDEINAMAARDWVDENQK